MRFQRQRLGALALVLAFLASQLAGLLHLALERHEVCAAHGELVHAAAGDAEPGRERRADDPRGLGLSGAPEPGEHNHCGVLPAIQPKHPTVASSPSPVPAPAVLVARVALPAWNARSSVPLLLLAPKHSPPA
jgi:hypothetical protein